MNPRRALAAMLISWLAVMIGLVLRGVADGELVCDDAYYYFEISRNAARGDGFTFDGVRPTNGFHPLWAWLLVPVFAASSSSAWVPIHAALVLSALCVAGAAVCAFLLFERRGRPAAGCLAAAVWLFNPYTWVLSGRGVEGPLNVLLIALAVLMLDSIRRRGSWSTGEAARLGAALGACLLARTDNVLLVAAFSGALLLEAVRRRGPSAAAGRGGALLGAALLVVSPWILWNLATFGTVVQTSFQAKQTFDLYGQLPPLGADAGVVPDALRNLGRVATYNAKYIAGEEWEDIDEGWAVLWTVAGLGLALGALPLFRALRRPRGGGPDLLPIGVFCALHFVWYALVGRNYYNWYFLPPVFAFCVLGGDRLGRVWALDRAAARVAVLAVVLAVAASAPLLTARHVKGWQPRQDEREFLASPAAQRLSVLPAGTRTGLWNSGRVGYFASFHFPDRYVINLDGVVNNEVPRYAREKTIENYILEHIEWVLEHPNQLHKYISGPRVERFVRQHVTPHGQVVR